MRDSGESNTPLLPDALPRLLRPAGKTAWALLLPGGALVAIAAGFVRAHIRPAIALPWMLLILSGAAMLLAVHRLLAHHYCRWRIPLRRLEELLTLAREGQVPIDELARADGALAGVRGQIQDVLRDLRQQKAEVARIEAEIRQLVAQRTNALEHTIGALRVQASRDPLTGLHNRRALHEQIEPAVARSLADGTDVCLLMLDLDNFKLLNDTLGHAAGDQFLRAVGQIIRSGIRGGDVAFRHGGDEFAVLMPGSGRQAGEALAGRLVALIDALGKTWKLPRPLGASAGVATLRELDAPSLPALLERADERQYEAKEERKSMKKPADLRPRVEKAA